MGFRLNAFFGLAFALACVGTWVCIHFEKHGGTGYFLFGGAFEWAALAGVIACVGCALLGRVKPALISLGVAALCFFVFAGRTVPGSPEATLADLAPMIGALAVLACAVLGLKIMFGQKPKSRRSE